ncbi:2-hydroxyacid dehydrogenase [Streptacidiphilus sp. PB12-B1b]|uniref:2-hydroxyacid dehydrogenase n=1 Tax=Streptacidiphilus sp. PB12-B1b TaxID=2705012 RepID=UPI0015FA8EE1|nr:2-hydroxyacid dehydrogenase [Streptacidiphilus sp. PB12-B1b]QMU78978.1 2-hydroxyacid dehydrogenase [Streptacidiphilus sp. PB12-B1b]
MTRYLLPYPPEQIGGLPADLDAAVWDGVAPPPPQEVLDGVEFFCLPYLTGGASLPLLARLPALRVVQTLTAGVDDVLPHVPAGVAVHNARGLHDASTAELAATLVLASLRGIPQAVRRQDTGDWQQKFHPALADRTVLIVGYGSIGAALEERLRPFECDIVRVARSARSAPHGPVHALDELPELLPAADVVVLLVPLTEQSRGLADAGFLARMKDGALLVNVARGPIVRTDALLAELRSGRLRAALDVTDPEPLPPGHPLWHAPNVLITPHVGGPSSAFLPRALRLLRAQLLRHLAGEPLANAVAAG